MTPAEPAAEDVRALFLAFMKFESRLSDNTVQSYGRDITKYLVFLGQAKVPLDRVRETDVVRFVQGQSAAGLAPRSMARLISALKAFYKFLILDGRVTKNPTVHLSSPKAWFSLPKFLTIKEVGTLLRQPDKGDAHGVRDRAMLETMYAAGLRVSELIGLRLNDVHLKDSFLLCREKEERNGSSRSEKRRSTRSRHIWIKSGRRSSRTRPMRSS